MTLAAAYQVWDKSEEDYDFAADEIEPTPCKLDASAEAPVKEAAAFDKDNLVEAEFV